MSATKSIISGFCRNSERKRPPARNPLEETIERGKRGVRIFRARDLIDDERHKLGQIRSRLLAAQRGIAPARANGAPRRRPRCGCRKPSCDEPIERFALTLRRGERQILLPGEERRLALEQLHIMALDRAQMRQQVRRRIRRVRQSRESGQILRALRDPTAAYGSARRPPSAADARRGARIRTPRSTSSRAAASIQPPAASAASVSTVPRPRSSSWRPPAMSCWVCAKNSISRMPPRPSLILWPSTAISPWPR